MDKYRIIQEIGKGSYGAVYKIQRVDHSLQSKAANSTENTKQENVSPTKMHFKCCNLQELMEIDGNSTLIIGSNSSF